MEMRVDVDCSDLPLPKVTRRVTRKQERLAADRKGSQEARKRSEGRCEVVFMLSIGPRRCFADATQVHHMIGGRGKRGYGISALAEHKQHVCDGCHKDLTPGIGGAKFYRIGGDIPRWDDTYKVIK